MIDPWFLLFLFAAIYPMVAGLGTWYIGRREGANLHKVHEEAVAAAVYGGVIVALVFAMFIRMYRWPWDWFLGIGVPLLVLLSLSAALPTVVIIKHFYYRSIGNRLDFEAFMLRTLTTIALFALAVSLYSKAWAFRLLFWSALGIFIIFLPVKRRETGDT